MTVAWKIGSTMKRCMLGNAVGATALLVKELLELALAKAGRNQMGNGMSDLKSAKAACASTIEHAIP